MTTILFFSFLFFRATFCVASLRRMNKVVFHSSKRCLKMLKKMFVQSRKSLSLVLVIRDAHFLALPPLGGCLGGSLVGVPGGGCDALMSGKTSMDPHGVDL